MAIYCFADLHGKDDFFFALLKKIQFDHQKDRLYFLGDAIDRHGSGISILRYLMSHQDSCVMIPGNHEIHFLQQTRIYDWVMQDPKLKVLMLQCAECYSKLFEEIGIIFEKRMLKGDLNWICASRKVQKWLKTGNCVLRRCILETVFDLAAYCSFDQNRFARLFSLLRNMHGQYKTKAFLREILKEEQPFYEDLKTYLRSCPRHVELTVAARAFFLCHDGAEGTCCRDTGSRNLFHASSQNKTYVFGHQPIGLVQQELHHPGIHNDRTRFAFDCRKVFAVIDACGNRYINIDTGSNPVAALRLDDMTVFYTGEPSKRKNAVQWTVPEEGEPLPPDGFTIVEHACFVSEEQGFWVTLLPGSKRGYALVTHRDGCYEFLIGVDKLKKRIYYCRIDHLELVEPLFTTTRWSRAMKPEETISYVREDYETAKTGERMLGMEARLRCEKA